MKSKLFLLATISVLLSGCFNNSESDLIAINVPNTTTYTKSIKATIDTYCISCHGNIPSSGAPMSLTTYQNVKDAVLNRGLIDRISKNQGSSGMMPLGGTRLSQSSINQIIDWKNNDFLQ
ncbi:hypothetical protein [Flavobacterium cellulosilyticum]|uniref:Cytochrome c n=1 Tax=Flavobacterium cellulosilyticum TaxID=2541731 RepID=A0A4R5CBK4_9FLAO|nr:hypothetical protein [Flavobacterium cellulosilyticum]TDD97341.1 hypothetical protein E0F76_08475 [Flavobacterium cellulosilyticum]